MITRLQQLKFQTHDAAVLVNSFDERGNEFYHVIKMSQSDMKKLNHDIKEKKNVAFKQYGEILLSGWGKKPSAGIIEEICRQKKLVS